MEATTVPYGRKTQQPPAIPEIDILWLTAGLGCDGDTIAMTAATNPSIEDLVLGSIPGIPKVNLHGLRLVQSLGSRLPWLRVLGCERACFEPGLMELSEPVQAAMAQAVGLVEALVQNYIAFARAEVA